MLKLVVLLSGRGSNFQSIEKAIRQDDLAASIELVVSDNPSADGIAYAKAHGIKTSVVDAAQFENKTDFNLALLRTVQSVQADWAILAGYMRLVNPAFLGHFDGRVLNIHPSLLPKYKGLNTHQRAIDAGDTQHGASVHLVTAALDDGPIILQAKVSILANDDAHTLAARVLEKEHDIYPQTIKWLANGALKYEEKALYFNNEVLAQPMQWPINENS